MTKRIKNQGKFYNEATDVLKSTTNRKYRIDVVCDSSIGDFELLYLFSSITLYSCHFFICRPNLDYVYFSTASGTYILAVLLIHRQLSMYMCLSLVCSGIMLRALNTNFLDIYFTLNQ